MLTEVDIDDPFAHICIKGLSKHTREQLVAWLKYRGDSLQNLKNMKDSSSR